MVGSNTCTLYLAIYIFAAHHAQQIRALGHVRYNKVSVLRHISCKRLAVQTHFDGAIGWWVLFKNLQL
jgi:hypothetical protein